VLKQLKKPTANPAVKGWVCCFWAFAMQPLSVSLKNSAIERKYTRQKEASLQLWLQ